MTSPVDELGEHDPGGESDPDDEERVRPAAAGLRALAELRARRGDGAVRGSAVSRRLSLCSGEDEARLQLAQERGIVGQRLRELGGDASLGGSLVGDFLEPRCGSVDELVGLRHFFFTGGSSPVVTRQIFEAVRRAAMVAAAASVP
jgi:hypothetical protein